MKVTRVLVRSALAFWAGMAVPGDVDVAWAQSVCTCPAGSAYLGNGKCATLVCPPGHHYGTVNQHNGCWPNVNDHDNDDDHPTTPFHGAQFNATCQSAVPSMGQVIALQQQSSFGAVSGVLRAKRDTLQGGATPPVRPVMGYAPSDVVDGSTGALGYAATAAGVPAAPKNPLYNFPGAAGSSPVAASAAGPTWATWVEGVGDWEKRNALNAYDVGRTQNTYATHVGLDVTWANPFLSHDYVVAGLVTNYTSTRIDLVDGARLRLEGPGAGLYAMYLNGGFSADVVGKFDSLTLKEDFAALGLPDGSINIAAAGAAGNVQYKYKFGWGFIEPTTGFAFTRVMFGDNSVPMGLKDGSTLRLQAGARIGGAFQVNGVSIEPTLGVLAYSNVIAEGATLATVGVPVPEPPTDKGLVRIEANPELNFNFDNGYSAYIRGSVRAGSEMVGGAAKVGLRKEF
jgi:hypothetical protein